MSTEEFTEIDARVQRNLRAERLRELEEAAIRGWRAGRLFERRKHRLELALAAVWGLVVGATSAFLIFKATLP